MKAESPKSLNDAILTVASRLENVPALSNQLLPEGVYASLSDFKAALRTAGEALQQLADHRGLLVVDRQMAMDFLLSMALVMDTRTKPLDEDFSVQHLLKLEHKKVLQAATDAKRILRDLVKRDMDYVGVQRAIDSSRDPEITRKVLSLMRPGAPKISTSAGIVDLAVETPPPKALPIEGEQTVRARILGGLDESTGTFAVQLVSTPASVYNVLKVGGRYRVTMLFPDHRNSIILAQLLQAEVEIRLNVDSAPLVHSSGSDLRLTLDHVDLRLDGLDATMHRLAEQIQLDLLPSVDQS